MSSLFSKLNQIKDLRKQAKDLQGQLAQETVTVEKNGVKLIMDGNQKLQTLDISVENLTAENKARLEETIKSLQNEAIQKVQKVMVEKMRASGNLNIPGLS